MLIQKFRVMKIVPSQLSDLPDIGLTDVGPGQYPQIDCDSLEEAESYIDDAVSISGKVIPGTEKLENPAHYPQAEYNDFYVMPIYIKE